MCDGVADWRGWFEWSEWLAQPKSVLLLALELYYLLLLAVCLSDQPPGAFSCVQTAPARALPGAVGGGG